MACGRTKCEALVCNVLAPKSVEHVVADLTSGDVFKPKVFSVSTDASNLKNRKMFPVCIQYFCFKTGVNKKLLDFVELNDEHSGEVVQMLQTAIEDCGLDVQNVSAYSADNASVNFGRRKSVFTGLQSINANIVKANCNAHVIHNTLRKVTDSLNCDVETIITSVYSHFSVSAVRREELQEFFTFVDLEYHELMRHVATRWLSLGPAINRMLQCWPAVVSYFRSLGEDCPKRIAKCLGLPSDNDNDDGGVKLSISRAYLHFVLNLCTLFEKCVLALEDDTVTVCELFPIMLELKNKLCDRVADRFFGFDASAILQSEDVPVNVKQTVETNFIAGLQRAISYLQQWFDFSENNPMNALQYLSLKQMPTFQQLSQACSALNLTATLNMDSLYDEFCTTKAALQAIVSESNSQTSVPEKWKIFFSNCRLAEPLNMFQLVSYTLSIPASNAFPERIFSLMNAKCRPDRNRMSVSLIKSELQVFTNFDLKCSEFYASALTNQKLLDAAASNTKYTWKKTKRPVLPVPTNN